MRIVANDQTRTLGLRCLWMALALLMVPLGVEPGQQGATTAPSTGTLPNFTGAVSSVDASDVRGVRFRYEAGARSYWHVHDGGLILLIEKGRGRIQVQGQNVQDLLPGQPVFLPGGVPHWHGAAPDEGLTWVALSIGRSVKWMAPVSDDEYLGRKK